MLSIGRALHVCQSLPVCLWKPAVLKQQTWHSVASDCTHSLLWTLHAAAGYKGASDLYIDANIQLAIAAGRQVSALA